MLTSRLKTLCVIELVFVAMSLAGVIMPARGSGDWIRLPPDAVTYFRRVLVSFGLLNGILLAIGGMVLLYATIRKSAN